jgi:hypothetical protein
VHGWPGGGGGGGHLLDFIVPHTVGQALNTLEHSLAARACPWFVAILLFGSCWKVYQGCTQNNNKRCLLATIFRVFFCFFMINFNCLALNGFYLKSFIFYRNFFFVFTVRQKIFPLETSNLRTLKIMPRSLKEICIIMNSASGSRPSIFLNFSRRGGKGEWGQTPSF